ncbi:MAG: LysR family transcriptional regulator, partial [Pseudomonadota bacterium]
MPLPKLSLQALEAFEHVARFGSMRRAARELGMSISSVSNHVARLEGELGVVLIDRSSRPFRLTREGREALLHLTVGLQHLRRATSQTPSGGLLGARSLRIGIIEDFESNVAPELAVVLAGRMPRATLTIGNVLSHEAPALLRKGELDLAIASEADGDLADLQTHPL